MPTPSWSKADSKIYDQKDLLFIMMDKAKTFKFHPKHKALYDALVASLIVDEDDMDRIYGKSHLRNNHDKDYPPDTDSKKKRRRDNTNKDPSANEDEGILDVETNSEDIGHNSTPSALVANKPNWFKESPLPESLDYLDLDLEYLRTENLEEKKYSASTTTTRAIRYELYGVEEMVENLGSKSLVAYDKDATYGISH
ncbi:hypothetical protein Tco_1482227 [Tanacetum coccineum]